MKMRATVRELTAKILLEGNINLNIPEISAELQKQGTFDDPCFRQVPGGVWSDVAEEFIGHLLNFRYVHFEQGPRRGYILTQEGKEFCQEIVADGEKRNELLRQIMDEVRPIPPDISDVERERLEKERWIFAQQCGWPNMDAKQLEKVLPQVGRNR